jgi:hypothetical protein
MTIRAFSVVCVKFKNVIMVLGDAGAELLHAIAEFFGNAMRSDT